MKREPPASGVHGARDDGFTMVEVIVALSLIAMVATASLYFFVHGTRSLTQQQRAHGAITLANDGMERAFAYVPTASTPGTSALVKGRTQADVAAAWATAATRGIAGLADTYPDWDTTTSPGPLAGPGDDTIPLVRTPTESDVQYTVTTLIGSCYRQQSVTNGPCTQTGGDATGVPNSGYTRMTRVMVVVTWSSSGTTCAGGSCLYQIASLVDPSTDVQWNNTTRLLAVDDAAAVNAGPGQSVTLDVLSNDTLPQISSNPVSLVSSPVQAGTGTAMGTATVDGSGHVVYTPGSNATGEVTFTYRVTVGARTAQAVIHVYVTPLASSVNVTTPVNAWVTVPITTVTGATPASVAVVQASGGTAQVSGTDIKFVSSGAGVYTISYTYKDASGMVSQPGTITVTVSTYSAPTVSDQVFDIQSSASATPLTMDMRTLTGNPTGYQTKVLSLLAAGTGTLKAGTSTATVGMLTTSPLSYTAPNYWAGTASFTFAMVTPTGSSTSSTATARIRVTPVATPDSLTVSRNTTNNALPVRSNDLATSGVTVVLDSASPSCGTFPTTQSGLANGTVAYNAPNSARTCTFQYHLKTTDASNPALVSSPVTVTVTVK